jgi:hypothetical protein
VLEVGYEGVGSWRVAFSARMDFFGLMTVQAFGHVQLQGLFRHFARRRTRPRHPQLRPGRQPALPGRLRRAPVVATPGLTEYFFLVEFSGGARLRAFGITFAGVDIGASITASGEGRVPLVASASASVKILFVRISVSMSFTHGLHRAAEEGLPGGQPDGRRPPVGSGGQRQRRALPEHGCPQQHPRHRAKAKATSCTPSSTLGSDASGETLRVVFSGRETIFKGVKKLVAFGGDGDDHIYVKEGVTSDVEFHGGDGNDVFIYDGNGSTPGCTAMPATTTWPPARSSNRRSCSAGTAWTTSSTTARAVPRSMAVPAATRSTAASGCRPDPRRCMATTTSTVAAAPTRCSVTAATI